MEYFLVGFFPKHRWTRENFPDSFPAPKFVQQICSASNCIVKGPSCFDYPAISEVSFNQYGGFNRLEDAKSVIPSGHREEYDIFAYWIPEMIYEDGQTKPAEIGCVEPDEIPPENDDFEVIGFDVIEMAYCSIGHSPLTCNGQAGLYESMLNKYCLVQKEADAIKLAEKFSIEKPEPGNYTVVEVWLLRA